MDEYSKLIKDISEIKKLRVVQIYQSNWKLFRFNLYIGLIRGVGSALGASIVIGLLAILLSYFEAIPVIGNFVTEYLMSLEYNQGSTINTIITE